MKIGDFKPGRSLMQHLNHVCSKLLDNGFFFLLVPKILPLKPIERNIFIIHEHITQLEPPKLWMNLFPEQVILDFLFIILVFHTDPILIFRFIILVFHETGDEF